MDPCILVLAKRVYWDSCIIIEEKWYIEGNCLLRKGAIPESGWSWIDKGERIERIFNKGKSREGLSGVALSPSGKSRRWKIRCERKSTIYKQWRCGCVSTKPSLCIPIGKNEYCFLTNFVEYYSLVGSTGIPFTEADVATSPPPLYPQA